MTQMHRIIRDGVVTERLAGKALRNAATAALEIEQAVETEQPSSRGVMEPRTWLTRRRSQASGRLPGESAPAAPAVVAASSHARRIVRERVVSQRAWRSKASRRRGRQLARLPDFPPRDACTWSRIPDDGSRESAAE
ncbi:hypothetical protein Trco_007359 [Trichoderma cornu-damae]|uniref:Uncharacterized protein n=1 Tax=Trichoderma cornu-damae TaxID=654480 RepID=A0A9P8QJM1_9HYPO|nr:hypothetical protein Trco_007359 [Trichoderma cornu-damae]